MGKYEITLLPPLRYLPSSPIPPNTPINENRITPNRYAMLIDLVLVRGFFAFFSIGETDGWDINAKRTVQIRPTAPLKF